MYGNSVVHNLRSVSMPQPNNDPHEAGFPSKTENPSGKGRGNN